MIDRPHLKPLGECLIEAGHLTTDQLRVALHDQRSNPRRTTFEHFLSSRGDPSAGIWCCEPGAWQIAFADGKDEFFCIISGRVRILDHQGRGGEFGPGEAGVIPAGFAGCFEVLAPVRKYFVVVDRNSPVAL